MYKILEHLPNTDMYQINDGNSYHVQAGQVHLTAQPGLYFHDSIG